MPRSRSIICFAICLFCLLEAPSKADIVISTAGGQLHDISGFSTFTTADMIGMEVTVYFADGTSDLQLWQSNGISTSDWRMRFNGTTTFSDPFVLRNRSSQAIVRFTMHGGGSTTVFDRGVSPSTSGSANGKDFIEDTNLSNSQDILVTYFDPVQLVGSAPVGDLFAGMDVVFENGINARSRFRFITDTDTVVGTVQVAVPQPKSAVPFLICCFVIGYCTDRKRVA